MTDVIYDRGLCIMITIVTLWGINLWSGDVLYGDRISVKSGWLENTLLVIR